MSPRDRILDAAMLVFRRHGFRRSSIEQAAEAAGLTRQALYHHFKSKEALFRAVIERLYESALAARDRSGDAAEKAGGSLADILVAEITARLAAHAGVVRGLAPYRGTVLRASGSRPRSLSEICRISTARRSWRPSNGSAASNGSCWRRGTDRRATSRDISRWRSTAPNPPIRRCSPPTPFSTISKSCCERWSPAPSARPSRFDQAASDQSQSPPRKNPPARKPGGRK